MSIFLYGVKLVDRKKTGLMETIGLEKNMSTGKN